MLTMMTLSNGTIFRVTGPLCGEFTGPGEFPAQRPVTRSFAVFFDLFLNKRLSKQPWGWWFETPPWSLWRQCNDVMTCHGNIFHIIMSLCVVWCGEFSSQRIGYADLWFPCYTPEQAFKTSGSVWFENAHVSHFNDTNVISGVRKVYRGHHFVWNACTVHRVCIFVEAFCSYWINQNIAYTVDNLLSVIVVSFQLNFHQSEISTNISFLKCVVSR